MVVVAQMQGVQTRARSKWVNTRTLSATIGRCMERGSITAWPCIISTTCNLFKYIRCTVYLNSKMWHFYESLKHPVAITYVYEVCMSRRKCCIVLTFFFFYLYFLFVLVTNRKHMQIDAFHYVDHVSREPVRHKKKLRQKDGKTKRPTWRCSRRNRKRRFTKLCDFGIHFSATRFAFAVAMSQTQEMQLTSCARPLCRAGTQYHHSNAKYMF